MKHYKDENNGVWAYDDDYTGAIHDGLIPINDEELGILRSTESAPTLRLTKVTMRQARLALLNAGLLDTVNTSIAAMAGAQGTAARIEWEYSQEVQRDRGLVLALGTQLGLSSEQLDDLFTLANTL